MAQHHEDEYRATAESDAYPLSRVPPEVGARNVKWLQEFLATVPEGAAKVLHDDLSRNTALHTAILGKSHQRDETIQHVARTLELARERKATEDDPIIVHTIAALWGVLVVAYEDSDAPEAIIDVLEELHEEALTRFLSVAAPQVDALCTWLITLASRIRELNKANGRILLVALPIGNSLPILLLSEVLRENARVETLQISLPRKEAARKAVLQEAFSRQVFQKGDLVVYLDEWSTGSNFKAICEILRKLVPPSAALVAAAVLQDNSQSDPRYESVRKVHDRVLRPLGLNGADYRTILPRIATIADEAPYFFWGENDRMAGLRKMQAYGLVFSTIDEAIERLHADERALAKTVEFLVAAMAPDKPPEIADDVFAMELRASFAEGYADYLACRAELKACGAEFARDGLIADFDAYLPLVLERYNAVTEHRAASHAIRLGLMFLAQFSGLDPGDRYRFEDHAPIIVPLTGRAKHGHDVALDILRRRMAAFRSA